MAALSSGSGGVSGPDNEQTPDTAIQLDTSLQEIANKFENDFSIEADADLIFDASDSPPRDSDTASNSSSLRETDERLEDNSDDSSKPKPEINNGEKAKSVNDKSSLKPTDKKSDVHLKPDVKGSKKKKGKDSSKVPSDTDSLGSKKSSSPSRNKNPLKLLRRLTKFDKSSKRSSFK